MPPRMNAPRGRARRASISVSARRRRTPGGELELVRSRLGPAGTATGSGSGAARGPTGVSALSGGGITSEPASAGGARASEGSADVAIDSASPGGPDAGSGSGASVARAVGAAPPASAWGAGTRRVVPRFRRFRFLGIVIPPFMPEPSTRVR
jgi:hypothetical protein